MKKLLAVALSLMLCVSVSFAARGGNGEKQTSSSSLKTSAKTLRGDCQSKSSGNFGLGYSKITITSDFYGQSFDFDQIAGRYWFSDTMGIDVKLGFGSGEANSRLLFSANLVGKFLNANKLNIYWLVGINFGNYKIKGAMTDTDISIFCFQGGVGAEYFVLPCLSVLTEMGIRYKSIKPDVTGAKTDTDFGIFADWLPQAGVRYYFN